MFAKSTTFALAAVAAFTPVVSAHGYIKEWGIQGQGLERAQKTDIKSSAFRAAPDNTGWIGSNFLTSRAITCGSSVTPGGTVAAPSGTIFSDASQSAGRELGVRPGQSVQFVVSGNPGEGWPHPRGHVATYLASCGGSCTNFDASKGKFFKIQQELNGIEKTLRPAYDGSVDGNRYNVKIPGTIPDGSYIMRFELLAFGQSSPAEGQQDQAYPFCGQIKVTGSNVRPNAAQLQTISFPGGYANGNIDVSTNHGPAVLASGTSSIGSGSSSGSSSSSGKKTSAGTGTKSSTTTSSSSGSIKLASSAPSCASMCLRVKISERTSLAPSCSSNDGACMCAAKSTFVQAFYNCAKDNCSAGDFNKAKKAFDAGCAAIGDDEEEDDCDEVGKRDVDEEVERVERELREVRELVERKKRELKKRLESIPMEKRYPAPGHAVVRPVVRSVDESVDNTTLLNRSKRHLVHGKRMVRERKSIVIKRS